MVSDEIFNVTYLEATGESASEAEDILRHHAVVCAQEQGDLRFQVFRRRAVTAHYAILEVWADETARQAHESSSHNQLFLTQITPALIAPPDTRTHIALDAVTPTKRGELIVITHVDVTPPNTDEGAALLSDMCRQSRSSAGCNGFSAFSQIDRPNHMTIIERWASEQDRQAHVMADHSTGFRNALAPLMGALYDERLYEALT